MAQLISPGISVTLTDDSNYLPAAQGSVPFVLLATAENKSNSSGATAKGTVAENAATVFTISSQRDLVGTFGYPTFQTSSNGTSMHGDELNEYGLLAAYSALGVSNRVYVLRADVDLNQLTGTATRPTGDPADGTYWIDLDNSQWGVGVWNASAGTAASPAKFLLIQSDSDQVPSTAKGTPGTYAMLVNATSSQLFYKTENNEWVLVGTDDWKANVPTYVSEAAINGKTAAMSLDLDINGNIVVISSQSTVAQVSQAINTEAIPGITTDVTTGNVLRFFVDSNAESAGFGTGADGMLTIGGGNAYILANLTITAGDYASPAVQFSTYQPEWKETDTVPRPTGSVWINVNEKDYTRNMKMVIKSYNATTDSWTTHNAPLYPDDYVAIHKFDPIAGGTGIPLGNIFVKYDTTEIGNVEINQGTFSLVNGAVTYTPYIKTVAGILKVVGTDTTPTFTPNDVFTVQVSEPGQLALSDPITVTLTGATANDFVTDFLGAVGDLSVVASVEASGAISISHLAGGYIRFENISGNALVDAGITVEAAHVRQDPDQANVLIASPYEPLSYIASVDVPSENPKDGTTWYYGTSTEVDIMIHDGSAWRGYRTVTNDARAYNLQLTDPKGPLFGTVPPTTQTDGVTPLASGDIWIDTSDLENYPIISRYDATLGDWVLIDNLDQLTENGIVFADARWDATGNTNPVSDSLTPIKDLLLSDYTDIDAPDYRSYARGTLLFNTRRSGYNVKQFVSNYFNVATFPYDQDDNPVSHPGHTAHTETNTWRSISGLSATGHPNMGRKAVRAVVVKALQAAIDSSTTLREENIDFNLMACPGYPELIDNMCALNADRKDTAFVIGDTPFRLTADATTLTEWCSAQAIVDGEDGLATVNSSLGVFYPSGLANDLAGNSVMVPPSHMMLRTIIKSDNIAYPWFAPAGVRRGTIDNVTSIGYLEGGSNRFVKNGINEALRDILYSNRINPITVLPNTGLVNFGNKTRAGTATALDRINVSRLVSYVRARLATIANNYLFEPNDSITRDSIRGLAESLFNDLMAKRGLTDYLVVCDDSNNTPDRIARNELWVDIAIEPTKDVEFIYIPIRIKNPGELSSGNVPPSNRV